MAARRDAICQSSSTGIARFLRDTVLLVQRIAGAKENVWKEVVKLSEGITYSRETYVMKYDFATSLRQSINLEQMARRFVGDCRHFELPLANPGLT